MELLRGESLGGDLRGGGEVAPNRLIVIGEDATCVAIRDEGRRQARGDGGNLFLNGQRHRGDGEGRSGCHGDAGVVPVGGILVRAVVVLLVSSEGACVAVRLAAALGQAGERLRRPDAE